MKILCYRRLMLTLLLEINIAFNYVLNNGENNEAEKGVAWMKITSGGKRCGG